MDELINQLTEKTGMSEDMAKQAVETVLDYVKTQLPAPIAGQIDALLGGGGDLASGLSGGLGGALGGLFGKK